MGHATARISPGHPLRRLFSELVTREAPDSELATYIANLLVDFVHVQQVYRIRDVRGKRLEEVGEMLVASDPLLEGGSFDREREVRKHIGDYTLFMAGMFPEHVAALPRRGLRLDSLIDYIKAGKESYRIVGAFDQFEHRRVAGALPAPRRGVRVLCVRTESGQIDARNHARRAVPRVEIEPSRMTAATPGGRRPRGRL